MPLSLNLISIAASGDRKSAVDKVALAPIHERQKDLIAEWEETKKQFEIEETAFKHARDQILKSKEKMQVEIKSDLEKLDRPVKPIFPIFISAPFSCDCPRFSLWLRQSGRRENLVRYERPS